MITETGNGTFNLTIDKLKQEDIDLIFSKLSASDGNITINTKTEHGSVNSRQQVTYKTFKNEMIDHIDSTDVNIIIPRQIKLIPI